MQISIHKEPSIDKWRIGWRFNAHDAPQYEVAVEKVGATKTYPGMLTKPKNVMYKYIYIYVHPPGKK